MSKQKMELFLLTTEKVMYVLLTFRANGLSHAKKIDLILEIESILKNKFVGKLSLALVWSNGHPESDLTIWSENSIEEILPHKSIRSFFSETKHEQYLVTEKLAKRINAGEFTVFPTKAYVNYFF